MKLNTEVKIKLLNLVALVIGNTNITMTFEIEKLGQAEERIHIAIRNSTKKEMITNIFLYSDEEENHIKLLDESIEKLKEEQNDKTN